MSSYQGIREAELTTVVTRDVESPNTDEGRSRTASQHSAQDAHVNNTKADQNESIAAYYEVRKRAYSFTPTAPNNAPTVLAFSNIDVKTRGKKSSVLLDNISGSITGGFWAIMGPSGGGKTTLLSTLSLRLDPGYMDISGDIRLNGREYSRNVLKAMSAYVMQDDLLHAELTVEETLNYAAKLRMPSNTTSEQRKQRIDEILAILGITHCKPVIIGNSRRKGISGGERKRVSVGVELLNHPKLIFLDEPTSGLDSATALIVCEALKNLTEVGECTVVCTIHQPQPKIYDLFDSLVLMKKGSIVYQGDAKKVENFLVQIGHPLPQNVNIADHLLDSIAPQTVEELQESHIKETVPINLSLGIEKPLYTHEGARNWIDQFTILFQRNFKQYIRNTDVIFMNVVASVLIAVFTGAGLWYQIGTGQDSIPKRVPSLFFSCITQGIIGALQAINSFPSERAIMLRERQAGTYKVSAYFAAKSAVDIISQFWPPIVFSSIVYFLIGYQLIASKFFIYTFFMVLCCLSATSYATAVTCFCGSIELSTVVLSFVFEVCRLFGGFFASPKVMGEYPDWKFADSLSFLKYSFIGIALNELRTLKLDCEEGETCVYTSGQEIINANGYKDYTLGYCAGILFVLIIGSRFLGYLALRFIR